MVAFFKNNNCKGCGLQGCHLGTRKVREAEEKASAAEVVLAQNVFSLMDLMSFHLDSLLGPSPPPFSHLSQREHNDAWPDMPQLTQQCSGQIRSTEGTSAVHSWLHWRRLHHLKALTEIHRIPIALEITELKRSAEDSEKDAAHTKSDIT